MHHIPEQVEFKDESRDEMATGLVGTLDEASVQRSLQLRKQMKSERFGRTSFNDGRGSDATHCWKL